MAVKDHLERRRDWVIRTILTFKDDTLDEYLPEHVSNQFRKLILDQVNDLCNLALDLTSPDTDINEYYLERIESMFKEYLYAEEPKT